MEPQHKAGKIYDTTSLHGPDELLLTAKEIPQFIFSMIACLLIHKHLYKRKQQQKLPFPEELFQINEAIKCLTCIYYIVPVSQRIKILPKC